LIDSSTLKSLKGKRIAVLGQGYIGKHLADYLELSAPSAQITRIIRGDSEIKLEKEYDIFFNCAGNTGNYRAELSETLTSNISLTVDILSKVKILDSYVCLSSTRVYGFSQNPDDIFVETVSTHDSHLGLDFIYDGSKKLMESYVVNMNSSSSANLVVARLSNLYGFDSFQDLDDTTLLKVIIKKGLEKQGVIQIKQNPLSSKDYVYIEDALAGLILCAVKGRGGEIYNIASGDSTNVEGIVNHFSAEATFNHSETALYSQISIKKAKQEIGYSPAHNILNYKPKLL